MNYLDILHTLESERSKIIHKEYYDAIEKYTNEDRSNFMFLLSLAVGIDNPLQIIRTNFITGFLLGIMFREKLDEIRKLEEIVK